MVRMNMKKHKQILTLGLALLICTFSLSSFLNIAHAATVNISEQIDVYLSTPNLTYKLNPGGVATLSVTLSSFTVTTGTGNSVVIQQYQGKDIVNDANLHATCSGSVSILSVGSDATVTITGSDTVLCSNNTSGGTGSSGSSGSSSSASSSSVETVTPAPEPTTAPDTPEPKTTPPLVPTPTAEPKVDKMGLAFDDVPGTDGKEVGEANSNIIYKIAKVMDGNGTFAFKGVKNYYPYNMTLRNFALQMALAAANGNCGVSTTYSDCKDAARKLGLFATQPDLSYEPSLKITRIQFYEILINALKLPPAIKESSSANFVKSILNKYGCSDVAQDSNTAKIMATARKYRIASVYAGNSCWPDKVFNRTSAAVFESRALDARAKLDGASK